MRKTVITILCFQLLVIAKVEAKKFLQTVRDSSNSKGFTLFVNQPVGLLTKLRFNLAYKTQGDHAFMLSVSNYYNFGIQTFLEYQLSLSKKNKVEPYFYIRGGFGETGNPNFKYYKLYGAGIGMESFIDKSKRFKMQGCFGLNGADYPYSNFDFFLGPGFPIDLNINFGYKF